MAFDIDHILENHEKCKAARAASMPDDSAALHVLQEVYSRLQEMGWKPAIYCPKDGTVFDAIEVGSTNISRCQYLGEWPTGGWWTHEAGDLWPSSPILYRLSKGES